MAKYKVPYTPRRKSPWGARRNGFSETIAYIS